MFNCSKCGECCRNLNKSELYKELHNGDGICKFLKGNLCSIYEKRPLLCNVDESYKIYFKDKMSLNEYYSLNYKVCKLLKEGE